MLLGNHSYDYPDNTMCIVMITLQRYLKLYSSYSVSLPISQSNSYRRGSLEILLNLVKLPLI